MLTEPWTFKPKTRQTKRSARIQPSIKDTNIMTMSIFLFHPGCSLSSWPAICISKFPFGLFPATLTMEAGEPSHTTEMLIFDLLPPYRPSHFYRHFSDTLSAVPYTAFYLRFHDAVLHNSLRPLRLGITLTHFRPNHHCNSHGTSLHRHRHDVKHRNTHLHRHWPSRWRVTSPQRITQFGRATGL